MKMENSMSDVMKNRMYAKVGITKSSTIDNFIGLYVSRINPSKTNDWSYNCYDGSPIKIIDVIKDKSGNVKEVHYMPSDVISLLGMKILNEKYEVLERSHMFDNNWAEVECISSKTKENMEKRHIEFIGETRYERLQMNKTILKRNFMTDCFSMPFTPITFSNNSEMII